MTHEASSPLHILPIFVFLFFVAPAGSSLLSGWHALAKSYRRRNSTQDGDLFTFSSVSLRHAFLPIGYHCLTTVQVTPEGISLSMSLLPLFLHPPLMIPWQAIADCTYAQKWWGNVAVMHVVEPATRLRFEGTVARGVWRSYQKYGGPKLDAVRLPDPVGSATDWMRKKLLDLSGQ